MSIVKLLAEYPNYSARKVRRLAKQLAILEEAHLPLGADQGILKGVADDLMEFNLLRAESEIASPPVTFKVVNAPKTWWGKTELPMNLQESHSEMVEMRSDWERLAKLLGFEEFTDPSQIFAKVEELTKKAGETERVNVCRTDEAIRAIESLVSIQRARHNEVDEAEVRRAKGIVYGDSFTADRHIVRVEEGTEA